MAAHVLRRILGMGGVPPGDNARTHQWERRLHGVMIAIAFASIDHLVSQMSWIRPRPAGGK